MAEKKKGKITKHCNNCNKYVTRFKSLMNTKHIFCSSKCKYNFEKGKNSASWKGGKIITKDKYVKVYCPQHPSMSNNNRYVFEHRLKMEKYLGRLLTSKECVHHKNENTLDNGIKNLEVLLSSDHSVLHTTGKKHTEITKQKHRVLVGKMLRNKCGKFKGLDIEVV